MRLGPAPANQEINKQGPLSERARREHMHGSSNGKHAAFFCASIPVKWRSAPGRIGSLSSLCHPVVLLSWSDKDTLDAWYTMLDTRYLSLAPLEEQRWLNSSSNSLCTTPDLSTVSLVSESLLWGSHWGPEFYPSPISKWQLLVSKWSRRAAFPSPQWQQQTITGNWSCWVNSPDPKWYWLHAPGQGKTTENNCQ